MQSNVFIPEQYCRYLGIEDLQLYTQHQGVQLAGDPR